MNFVRNLDRDEFRCGFLVTSDRKKLWNTEINLLHYFQQLCEKHHLKFFMTCGTLLGAVRHQGFIPWDDDVDVAMPREDYNKLREIAKTEIRHPYYFDFYADNDEPEDPRPILWWPRMTYAKLRDSRTSMIEFPTRTKINQGIWIDIFPMDPVPPFDDEPNSKVVENKFKILRELYLIVCHRTLVIDQLKKNPPPKYFIPRPEIERLLKLDRRESGEILEQNITQFNHQSKYLSMTFHDYRRTTKTASERVWWNDTIYLPFEDITLPAPKRFDEVLKKFYGDYKKFVKPKSPHASIYSSVIDYKEYFAAQPN